MTKKILKRIGITMICLLAAFFVFTEICIYRYLKEYGFGAGELFKTTLVYLHISDGFTVNDGEEETRFIGRSNGKTYYAKLIADCGYDRYGEDDGNSHFAPEGKSRDDEESFELWFFDDWCHWFRVGHLNGGHKIEDFTE